MIILNNIKKEYDRLIFENVNLVFEKGKIYVIKGISGSGKTTLLNIISGLDTQFFGEYKNDSKTTSYIFQKSLLFSHLNILDNLMLVNSDKNEIDLISKMLEIQDLYYKKPEYVSVGERQRIAIARALLVNPDLIIADEPTASLDHDNSVRVADIFNQIRNDHHTIIISTHEDCFDDIADEILYLNDAHISVKKVERPIATLNHFEIQVKTDFNDTSYSFKKIKNSKWNYLGFSIFIFILCFISFLSIGLFFNLKNDFITFKSKDIPFHVASLSDYEIEILQRQGLHLKIYENYNFELENAIIYPYYEFQDSYFKIKSNLEFGKFPESSKEILVNRNLINSYFYQVKDITDIIGEKIYIQELNMEFIISGIIQNQVNAHYSLYNTNPYFEYSENQSEIFVHYDLLKTFGNLQSSSRKNVSIKDLLQYPDLVENMIYMHNLNYYQEYLLDDIIGIEFTTQIIFTNVIIFMIISVFFMNKIVQLQLMIRKREITYLRLFHVSKKRIYTILISHYLFLFGVPLTGSLLLFSLLSLFVNKFFSISLFFEKRVLFLLFLIIILWFVLSVIYPIHKAITSKLASTEL